MVQESVERDMSQREVALHLHRTHTDNNNNKGQSSIIFIGSLSALFQRTRSVYGLFYALYWPYTGFIHSQCVLDKVCDPEITKD